MQSGKIEDWLEIIQNSNESVTNKYKAIFQLRQFENIEGARALMKGFPYLTTSELLQHEVTYALGQMKIDDSEEIKKFLLDIFQDEKQYPVVRHESGEALSNFAGFFDFLELFEKYSTSSVEEVRDTSILALEKAKTYEQLKEKYGTGYSGTREPAAPLNQQEIEQRLEKSMEKGKELEFAQDVSSFINSQNSSLWEKYRSLYYLRDLSEKQQSQNIVKLIAELLFAEKASNNLFRHEICFVLGQVGHLGQLIPDLVKKVISDKSENHIVRHEAISAFQGVSSDRDYMLQFMEDPAPIVKESAIVAYDMVEYWN